MLSLNLNVIERGVRGIFAREFITRQRASKYGQFCTVVDSDKQEEKYNSISTVPQLSEVTDERVLAGFKDYSYTLKNKVYMNGIKIPRTLFEFDQTGQISTLVQSVGSRVANFPDKLVFNVMGDNPTGYDGVAVFSSSHDLGNGSQDNLLTSNLTSALIAATTAANRDIAIAAVQLDFNQAKSQLYAFTDDRGEPWHDSIDSEGLMILCHPSAEFFFRTALEATIIGNTGNTMLHQAGKIMITPYSAPFTYPGDWYLMKVDTPIKPFIFQRFGPKTTFPDSIPEADQLALQALQSVEVQTIFGNGSNVSESTFFNDEYLVGSRVLYSAGIGMWQNVVKMAAGS